MSLFIITVLGQRDKMYSQSSEELHITNYLKGFTGTLLSVGENDGKTFSNALRLIELGWRAVLVEPSPVAFKKLLELHKDNPKVDCYDWAIGETDGAVTLHESSHHLKDKSDYALLSTLNESEKTRWKDVEFKPVKVHCVTYKTLLKETKFPGFDFITIDAEGNDMVILKKISLTLTKLLCIEHNSNEAVKSQILGYCEAYGMKNIIYQSAENLLIAR